MESIPILKITKVVPIFKRGRGSQLCIKNYRLISLLSTLNKIFEKLTYHRLGEFLSKFKILFSSQYGFTAGKNTSHAAFDQISNITHAYTSKSYNISVFIDFSKAFYTIDHTHLLNKLWNYGVRGIAFCFLESYITARTQFVVSGRALSQTLSIKFGIPQGSFPMSITL